MNNQPGKIGIVYGPLADSPEEQLRRQGFTLGGYKKTADRMLDGLYFLRLNLMLPDGLYTNILNRIHNKIIKNIQAKGKPFGG